MVYRVIQVALLLIIVNQSCHSGTMMPHLYGENRILISAADSTDGDTDYGYYAERIYL